MTAIPPRLNDTAALIDRHHEAGQEPPRPHMGCSMLGHPCDRYLWLAFRWMLPHAKPGRLLRLFRRGHIEEHQILKDLRAIGCVLRETTGGQIRVDFGSHVSGSVDAVIESGLPESPNKPHVAEFKTHSRKSFEDLAKHGVEKSKPQHYVQMQVYMHGLGIDRALYLAVCKDDDRLHVERVRLDKDVAEKAVARGKRLAIVDEMPPPLSTDPSWYQCKMCDGHRVCHVAPDPPKSCRSCAHSTAKEDGTWRCERFQRDGIPLNFQRMGCDEYELHDHLLPF